MGTLISSILWMRNRNVVTCLSHTISKADGLIPESILLIMMLHCFPNSCYFQSFMTT